MHTWDLSIYYHHCPQCGRILESRGAFAYRLGAYKKNVKCSRCGHPFVATKPVRPRLGPLFGEPSPAEMDWESREF